MVTIVPRSYQTECVSHLYKFFEENKTGNPICALPTGTGKSLVIALFLESIFQQWMNQKVLVITHVKELIAQNYAQLIRYWPGAPAGIYSSGLNKRDTLQKIIFCGIASIAKRVSQFGHVDLVIVDEAHLVSPSEDTMYRTFIDALMQVNPKLRVIGFTATKWRLGHGDITEGDESIFTHTCFDITGMAAFNRLIAEGYIAPLIPKRTQMVLNTDGVHMRGGEYIAGELQAAVNRDEITERALREAIETCGDRKHWLIFAAGVDHAIAITDMLNEMGVNARAVHSKMSSAERDKNIKDAKAGVVTALVNNNVLTTGFDFPAIDLIICLRPTASTVLWVQMLGRGTRPSPGKENCLVLDFAANTRKLGPINDPVIPRKKGQKGGDAPVKVCPVCECYMHASVRWCTGVTKQGLICTHEFVFETKLKQGASTEELIKGDLPIVERFRIEHITFAEYNKVDRPPSVRVTYFCGLQKFDEYVCIEHQNFAGVKAKRWIRDRLKDKHAPLPTTTAQVLAMIDLFKIPSEVRVWVNKKYPEIMSFDWTEDESITVDKTVAAPSHYSFTARSTDPAPADKQYLEDDDIPF